MGMTPEEYAARELNVLGYTDDEPLYAPGSNPSEQGATPSFADLIGQAQGPHTHQAPPAPKEPESPAVNPEQVQAMSFEYNFTLPLQLRRLELISNATNTAEVQARIRLWKALSASVFLLPILGFIIALVK